MSDKFRELFKKIDDYGKRKGHGPEHMNMEEWDTVLLALTAAEERDSLQAQLDEQNGILGELANTPSGAIIAGLRAELEVRWNQIERLAQNPPQCGMCAALKAKLEAVERTLTESRERAARELWDKDDALTKLHRRISELEAALAESQEVIRQNAVDFAIANGAIANLQHALGESEKLRTAMVAENTWKSDDYDRLRTEFTKLILELGESRKKVEELEDRLNDIHIHNLERD